MKYSVADWNKNFKDWNGFDDSGNVFIFLGNTYAIKDEIKQLGGKWNPDVGAWLINYPVDGYALMPVHIDDMYGKDYAGKYNKSLENIDSIQCLKKELEDYINSDITEAVSFAQTAFRCQDDKTDSVSILFVNTEEEV